LKKGQWPPKLEANCFEPTLPCLPKLGSTRRKIAFPTNRADSINPILCGAWSNSTWEWNYKMSKTTNVEDFIVQDTGWVIRYMVVDTRNWLPGKKVLIATDWIEEINWVDRQVHVNMKRDNISE
jgi:hypothetical protein